MTLYKPRLVFIEGNHEYRIARYVEQNPSMYGQIDLDKDLHLTEMGFEIIPYRAYFEEYGVMFTHVPIAANMQPVSGASICHTASRYTSKSCVFGHSHRFETINIRRAGDNKLKQILTAGSFFDVPDKFIQQGCSSYWEGVTLLHHYDDGLFDIEQISKENLLRRY